jgi:mRNA-degrading endonuclease RelE of RelBE toxin-antitoxin system
VAYRIEYSPEAEEHLRALTRRQQAIVLDVVETRLTDEPLTETRNRKRMRPNDLALWELRIGDLRVYYDVDRGPPRVVQVRAVGTKSRDRVRIGKETFRP